MSFRLLLLVFTIFIFERCSDDEDALPVEPVISAYDTLELRYQQLADITVELISNVSEDSDVRASSVQDLLDRQPVVNLDFRKPLTTRKEIVGFITYQRKIDASVESVFSELQGSPRWKSAPLFTQLRARYNSMKDTIAIATRDFNLAVKEAKLPITIPLDHPSKLPEKD